MKLFVLVCVVAQLIIANARILSDLPGPCHKGDPNLKSCFLKQIQKIIPRLETGIPEYKILPVDPLDLPYVFFNRTLNDFFVINALLKNVRIVGFSQVSVEELKVDPENYVTEITVKHPWFTLDTEFKFNGKIAGANMEMQAHFGGNFTDVTNHFKVSLKPIVKKGVKYFEVDNFKLDGTIGDAELEIIPKDSSDQPLVDFALSAFRQNKESILELFLPLYGEAMGDVLRSVFERALAQVPANKLFVE